jgi:cytochrome c oxidase subunit II
MTPSRTIAAVGTFLVAATGTATVAQAAQGNAVPWQMTFQDAATPVAEQIHSLHDILLVIITLITLFVLGLLLYCMVRFNAKSNPTPSRTSHNTLIEVLWTTIPVLILVVIAIPSFKLLYYGDRTADAEMTLKAIGKQWYWSYEYPDNGDIAFDALIVEDADLKAGQPRLLTADTAVVLPVDTNIRLLTTAEDVIHSWAMPSFGIKLDAVPGRTNETWFRIEAAGMYYGQCSELCGTRHGFMPIMVKAVSKDEFKAWVEKTKSAAADGDRKVAVRVAEASHPSLSDGHADTR